MAARVLVDHHQEELDVDTRLVLGIGIEFVVSCHFLSVWDFIGNRRFFVSFSARTDSRFQILRMNDMIPSFHPFIHINIIPLNLSRLLPSKE